MQPPEILTRLNAEQEERENKQFLAAWNRRLQYRPSVAPDPGPGCCLVAYTSQRSPEE